MLLATTQFVILVVDDDPCVLNTICCILAHAGHEVLRADSAESALNLTFARSKPIDLLLTDVVMPGLSGPALAEEFHRLYPQTRMLFMAGLPNSQEICDRVIRRGHAFLPKPFLPAVLLETIHRVMETPLAKSAHASA